MLGKGEPYSPVPRRGARGGAETRIVSGGSLASSRGGAGAAGGGTDIPIDTSGLQASEVRARMDALGDAEDDPTGGLSALAEVLQYREYRLRQLRGETLEPQEHEELARLRQRLQQPTGTGTADTVAALRRYQRFDCALKAELTHRLGGSMSTLSVGVQNIGAGGAKLTAGQHELSAGDVAWLAIDVSASPSMPVEQAKTVVFKSRVVWVRSHAAELGVVFAGAPRYDAAEALAQDLP